MCALPSEPGQDSFLSPADMFPALPDHPPPESIAEQTFSQQQQHNRCGLCRATWATCECDASIRTESLTSLFSNPSFFPDALTRHLCVFVYHTYTRFPPHADADDFTAMSMPCWEGWYHAWLKPSNVTTVAVPWAPRRVLPATLVYFDGSVTDAWLTRDGCVFAHVRAACPPAATHFDHDRRLLRVRLPVTQALSVAEVRHAARGAVRRADGVRDVHKRAAFVSEIAGETTFVTLLEDGRERRRVVPVETERVQEAARGMFEEARWRGRRRFTKKIGAVVQLFLQAMVERARAEDEAVRYVLRRGWRDGLPATVGVLRGVASRLAGMGEVFAAEGEVVEANGVNNGGAEH